jgi:hypothetical protein
MNPEILRMQQDLEKFRASKMGGGEPSLPETAPVATSSVPSAPVSDIDRDLQSYRAARQSGTLPKKKEAPKENTLKNLAKGIFSAPVTTVARPFQAVAAIAGASNDQIDEFSQNLPIVGGLIADAPDTMSDVKKDVGRAAQTVALGTGAPIAGGALFGAGASLEQGNDLISAETAFNAATGGAAGKVLQWVGKPILNASGKVVGTITPQMIKDAAAGGAQSIQKFMAEHQLLGGIAAKPSQKLASGLQKVDDVIEGGIKNTFTGVGKAVQKQYPNISPTKHYVEINKKDILRPTTVNERKYSKATNIYKDAQKRGVKIEDVATRKGVVADEIIDGGVYNTADYADSLRQQNFAASQDIARPALEAAEPGTRLVPVSEVREALIKHLDNLPTSQLDDIDREILKRKILKEYADGGVVDRANPNGYSLTKLHDNRIIYGKKGKYKPGADSSTAQAAQLAREQGRVFAEILDKTAPEELGMKAFRKELEEGFLLADYLEALDKTKAPEGVAKKAVRLFGRATAATVGGKVGGFPGAILGAQYGDMLFSGFNSLPTNPLKLKFLAQLEQTQPAAHKALLEYIGKEELRRLQTLALPPGNSSSFKPESPRLFATQGGKLTPNRQEAVDMAAVESGAAKRPFTEDPRWQQKVIEAQENLGAYLTPSQMETIMMGKKVKLKVDSKVIDIDADSLPKVFGPDLKNPPEPYIPDDNLPVIDFGPKPKAKKSIRDIYID